MASSRLSILTDEEREFLFELDAEDIKYLDSIKKYISEN